MLNAVLSPPNAILFVFDPTNKDVVIPPYVDGELTASSSTCVSIGTQSDVDGATNVSLSLEDILRDGLYKVFVGAIEVPSGKVAVVTSHLQRVLELEVRSSAVEVTIWTDELRNPSCVSITVK